MLDLPLACLLGMQRSDAGGRRGRRAAEWVRDTPGHVPPRLFGIPAGRALAALSGLGLLGTSGEAASLHCRGAFQNKAMFAPVTIPPVGAALLLNAAVAPKSRERWLAPMCARHARSC